MLAFDLLRSFPYLIPFRLLQLVAWLPVAGLSLFEWCSAGISFCALKGLDVGDCSLCDQAAHLVGSGTIRLDWVFRLTGCIVVLPAWDHSSLL